MPKFGQRSLDRLHTCHPNIQRVMDEVIKHFDITVIFGHRTYTEQEKAFNSGNSKKHWPDSKHNRNLSHAIDIAPWPLDYSDIERFRYMAGFVMGISAIMGVKLRWGGDWDMDTEVNDNTFNDLGHFEVME